MSRSISSISGFHPIRRKAGRPGWQASGRVAGGRLGFAAMLGIPSHAFLSAKLNEAAEA